MKKILAVALLDLRRFGFGLISAALVAGLLPSLANGLGAPVETATILAATFLLVGAVCGGYFGTDFAEGRSSFFFARPLPTWALITGRAAALLALAGVAFLAFMASSWISSTEAKWTAWILEKRHAYALVIGWSVSLFVSLGVAARARDSRGRSGMRDAIVIPLRLSAAIAAFFLMFGLFADLVLRAYFASFRPIELFLWSWAIASLVASFVAIASGRTERLRIARLQSLVMGIHFVLISLVVAAAWSYVLHPGPDAIEKVGADWGSASADGGTAIVSTRVNRGDGNTFEPIFVLDIASGQAVRLNADRHDGPWTSADGSSVVWSEATPFFFRPLWRRLGGETTFRVRGASGEIRPLPMPSKAPDYRTARELSRFGGVIDWVLPAPDGDTFAILWDRHLTFTSHTRGELSETNYGGSTRSLVRTALFRPSGELRMATVRRDAGGEQILEFVDIQPRSGEVKVLRSLKTDMYRSLLLDSTGDRALMTSGIRPDRRSSVVLVHLNGDPGGVDTTTLLAETFFPTARFMADGRIVVSSRAALAAPYQRSLTVLSPEGKPVLSIPTAIGHSGYMGAEMFPGVLAMTSGVPEVATTLFDTTTGKVLRELPGLRSQNALVGSPPPGSATARLLHSVDGKLYELPSLDAPPRLLLPLTRR